MEILPEALVFWIYLQKLQIAQYLEGQNGMGPELRLAIYSSLCTKHCSE